MDIKTGNCVRVLRGKHKGKVFTVNMIARGTLGDIHLYLTRGQVVIFKTVKQVERVK